MKKVLVTGGQGFIGSNFIRYILERRPDYYLVSLDKMTYAGQGNNLAGLRDKGRYRFIRGDICSPAAVERAIKGCDTIVNFAAESHVDRSIVGAADFIRTNIEGTRVLLDAARKHRIGRYIQISTDEVYGSIRRGSFDEQSPLLPNSPYSASKAAADMLARSYFVTYGLPVIITRSSNNFGPYQYPEKVIPLFITNLIRKKRVPLYGDGLNVRDWLYVRDNCAAIDLVLRKGRVGQVYNIGGDCEMTNRRLTSTILRKMGRGKEYIKYVRDRLGHDRRYSLDCEKIKALGWRPEYSFGRALDLTIRWYRDNQIWWERLIRGA